MSVDRPVDQQGLPVAPTRGRLRPVPAGDVDLDGGGFWGRRQQLLTEALLPHARQWTQRLGWLDAFRSAAAGQDSRPRRGKLFTDADVYKLLEAHVWWSRSDPSGATEEAAADLARLVRSAQGPDGYLNTWYGVGHESERYTDAAQGFELYCTGHLLQATVAALRRDGPAGLIDAGLAAAQHLHTQLGSGPRTLFDGHPALEAALVELARATGEQRHLDLACRMLDSRGHRSTPLHAIGPEYYLDDVPVRQARVLRGHVVRALYLLAGAVDVAVETGDDALLGTLVQQWDGTIAGRTHLHGGMGSRHLGESFGEDFELPPDRAYAETCTAVAGVMAAWRLTLATGEPRFADHAERALFNVVATSVAPGGRRFLYVNPLQSRAGLPEPGQDEAPFRKDTPRAPWFWVACCPTNVARLLASLGGYVATTDDQGLQLHQYATGAIRAVVADALTRLRVRTDYPWTGRVEVEVLESGPAPWTLSLRVPGWAGSATIQVVTGRPDERTAGPTEVRQGTAQVRRRWAVGDVVVLELEVSARATVADPRVDALRGTLAVERGPLVYCAERPGDEAEEVLQVTRGPGGDLGAQEVPCEVPGADPGAVSLRMRGSVLSGGRPGWPFGASTALERREVSLDLVPLHLWGLRGRGPMRVFLPVDPASGGR